MAKILLVDDNEIDRELYKEILLNSGHDVIALDDGKAVIKTINQNNFDVLLLDVMMEHDAFSVINDLPKQEILVPVIAMSSSSMYLDILKEFGITEFLTKPFLPEELIDTISRMVNK